MADISEALERLAGLRDRGILTPEEFAEQKARLLDPTVAPAAPIAPARSPDGFTASTLRQGYKTPLYILAGIALLALVGAGMWGTGFFSHPTPLVTTASTANGGMSPPGRDAAAPVGSASSLSAASINPMLGEWASDGDNPECPTRLTVLSSEIDATLPDGKSDVQNVSFTVQDANTVQVSFQGGVALRKTASVRDGHLSYQSCGFHHG